MGASYGLTEFELTEDMEQKFPTWVLDGVHCLPTWTPFYSWSWHDGINRALTYYYNYYSIPRSKGLYWAIKNGQSYVSVIMPKAEEIPEREKKFREMVAPYVEDFQGLYDKGKKEFSEETLKRFQEFDLKNATDYELYKYFDDFLFFVSRGWWDFHMKFMMPSYAIYQAFCNMCQEVTGIKVHDHLFNQLMGGWDNIVFQVNREIWNLGLRMEELGLADLFKQTDDDEEVMKRLKEIVKGLKFLEEEFDPFIQKRGWRTGRLMEYCQPSWIEKPSLALAEIRKSLLKEGKISLDEQHKRLVQERYMAEKEVLSRVPEGQKGWFGKMMKAAQASSSFSEDHNYYSELPIHAIGRHLTQEYGRRYVKAGILDEVDDILFLLPGEIRKAAISMNDTVDLRPYARARKKEWEEYNKMPIVPIIGTMEGLGIMVVADPCFAVIAAPPMVKEELKADLYGAAAALGVVEGIARVILDPADLSTFKPGEILVAQFTDAVWTPVFGIAGGVVTDFGGALCHAAIVSREYGIPAVVGTQAATQMIKTGMRIKVDGNNAAVWIL